MMPVPPGSAPGPAATPAAAPVAANGSLFRPGTDNLILSESLGGPGTGAGSSESWTSSGADLEAFVKRALVERPGSAWATLHAAAQAGPQLQLLLAVQSGAVGAIGLRDHMEDRHVVAESLAGCPAAHLYLVLDGHRGAAAAEFVAAHAAGAVAFALAEDTDPGSALATAFLALDAAYVAAEEEAAQQHSEGNHRLAARPRPSGCCAVAALLWGGRTLYLANAGDCRAVLLRDSESDPAAAAGPGVTWSEAADSDSHSQLLQSCHRPRLVATALTRDHTANDPAERERLTASGHGGALMAPQRPGGGGWRVAPAALEVTRSLGDADMRGSGVTPSPEVSSVELGQGDVALILGCDGLWDTLTLGEAARLVAETVKQPAMLASRLVEVALSEGSDDNVTALVVLLKGQSTLERIY